MDEYSILPLLPKSSLVYFEDAQSSDKLYLRATSIRSCLENIVDTVFVHIIGSDGQITEKQWSKKTLFDQLNLLDSFFPDDIREHLHSIRKIGNKGAHQKAHKDLTEDDISNTLNSLSKVCEWTILSYFKKNGFNHDSWLPTIFSTLQPVYRIRILEELFDSLDINKEELIKHLDEVQESNRKVFSGEISPDFNYVPSSKERELGATLLIIDKLAMAYLKNHNYEKSLEFIESCYNEKIINDQFTFEMKDKLNILWKEIDNLPISKNTQDTKSNFEKVMGSVKKEEESLFITLFMAVISQNELIA